MALPLKLVKGRLQLKQSFGLERAARPNVRQINLGQMLSYVVNELFHSLETECRTNSLEPLLGFRFRESLGLKIVELVFNENKLEVIDVFTPISVDILYRINQIIQKSFDQLAAVGHHDFN